MPDNQVAILGVGMHPWGKWGRSFVEYGLSAARAALDDAGILPTGQGVGVIDELPTVEELIGRIMDEAAATLRRLGVQQ